MVSDRTAMRTTAENYLDATPATDDSPQCGRLTGSLVLALCRTLCGEPTTASRLANGRRRATLTFNRADCAQRLTGNLNASFHVRLLRIASVLLRCVLDSSIASFRHFGKLSERESAVRGARERRLRQTTTVRLTNLCADGQPGWRPRTTGARYRRT
jgi:hypothetical protein